MAHAQSIVVMVVERAGKVLAVRRDVASGWGFPSGACMADEGTEEASRRLAREGLGFVPSVAWLFDTLPAHDKVPQADCYVVRPARGAEPSLPTYGELAWFGRDELLGVEWDDVSQLLVEKLGAGWDLVFMSEHW